MEPRLILTVAVAAYVIGVLWAARRSAKGDARFTGLIYLPMGLALIWVGITVASSNLALSVVMVLTGAITVALLVRAIRVASSSPMSAAHASGMPEPWIDYLVWTSIGVPIVLAVLLLVMAIADRLNAGS